MIRKRLTSGLAVLLLLAVTGCGKSAPMPGAATPPAGGSAPAATPGNATAPAAAPPQTSEKVKLGPLKKGESAKVGPLEVTLTEIAAVKQTAGLAAGYAYVLLNMSVKNNGTAPYTINNADHFKMTSPDGNSRNLNMQANGQRTPTLAGTVDKGQSKAGWLGYMPKLQAGGKFIYVFTHPDYGEATWEFVVE